MILKPIMGLLLVVLLLSGAEYFTWNLIVTKLPISGITLGHLSFSLALKLTVALLVIQVITMFGVKIFKDLFSEED